MKIKDFMKIKTLFEYTQDENEIARELLKLNKDLKLKQSKELANEYVKSINNMPDKLIQRFKIAGVEFGIIPDFEEMSTAEYLDLDSYQNDTQHIDRLMAVLYRPIVKSKGDKYEIEKYEGSDKYKDVMREVDSSIFLSATSFFFHLSALLLLDLNTSSNKKKKPQKK